MQKVSGSRDAILKAELGLIYQSILKKQWDAA